MSLLLRQVWSSALLLVSVVIVCVGIANDYSMGDFGGPVPAFFFFLLALVLLSINEGYQTALISSKTLDISNFTRAQRVKTLIFSPDGTHNRLPRLFLGQSFMVVTCTFVVSSVTVFTGWPRGWLDIFTTGGVAGILVCVNLAQLLPSIWATKHPAEYLQSTPVIGPVVSGALFIESIGLFHFTFVFVRFLELLLGQAAARPGGTGDGGYGSHPSRFSTATFDDDDVTHTMEMNPVPVPDPKSSDKLSFEMKTEPLLVESAGGSGGSGCTITRGSDRSPKEARSETNDSSSESHSSVRYKVKMVCSSLLQCLCMYYLLTHLFRGHSIVPLPAWALLIIILVVYYIVFLAEGMKIAVVGIAHLPKSAVHALSYDMNIYKLLQNANATTASASATPEKKMRSGKSRASHSTSSGSEVFVEPTHNSDDEEDDNVHDSHDDDKNNTSRDDLQTGVSRFLLGRQMLVVPANFLIATIFTFAYPNGQSRMMHIITALSLPTVICTLQFVQLAPQVLAGAHPQLFFEVPGSSLLVRAALAIQTLGLTEIAYLLCDSIPPDASWHQILRNAVNAIPRALCGLCGWVGAHKVPTGPPPIFALDDDARTAKRSFDGVFVDVAASDDDEGLGGMSDSHGRDDDPYRPVRNPVTEVTSI